MSSRLLPDGEQRGRVLQPEIPREIHPPGQVDHTDGSQSSLFQRLFQHGSKLLLVHDAPFLPRQAPYFAFQRGKGRRFQRRILHVRGHGQAGRPAVFRNAYLGMKAPDAQ